MKADSTKSEVIIDHNIRIIEDLEFLDQRFDILVMSLIGVIVNLNNRLQKLELTEEDVPESKSIPTKKAKD